MADDPIDDYDERLDDHAREHGVSREQVEDMEDWEDYPGHKEDNLF